MSEQKTIIIATKNEGKAKEFKQMLEPKGYYIKTLLDYPEIEDVKETGYTFEDNARLKAETISELLQTAVLADDSGLCIDALDGAPGVFSARFSGEEKNDARNNAKVLAMLGEMTDVDRSAHFHCTLVLSKPGKESLVVEGKFQGEIAQFPQGDSGFGYDPIFFLPELGKSVAELSEDEKNTISHRALALKELDKQISEWFE
ncbi:XTP/dITP diphosphatase [Jeotgalibaca arthritidis]|uniref:dITP/XTP pyrophosphatase n=1 Tax=Jeotgalibaca arthritidis TaxID=1868794 RepID=A0A6G7KCP3_9LACT|nr:XTP/dITP diphosphatase [Jeotgalibaca arthritidis]QII83029.1 XTP/dITP diphosphatase [Jeotgalibaca arthritidis]